MNDFLRVYVRLFLALGLIAYLFFQQSLANSLQDIEVEKRDKKKKEQDFTLGIGPAVIYLPKYEGSQDSETIVIPYLSANYKDFLHINLFDGMDYDIINNNGWMMGVGLGIDFGRPESQSEALEGVGDIDPTVEPKAYVRYEFGEFSAKLTISVDAFGDEHEGATLDFDINYTASLSQRLALIPSLSATFADQTYMQTYFGITPEQSQRSPNNLSEYSASSGFKNISANASLIYSINRHWNAVGFTQLKYLMDAAKNSPLTEDKTQYLLGAMLVYHF